LRDRGAFPEAVFSLPGGQEVKKLVDGDTAVARYDATLDWFDKYGHLVISNGPFTLARYDPPAQFAELHAFRDPAYPFKPGDHYRGRPELIEFVRTQAEALVPGSEWKAEVSVHGPGALGVRYLLLDASTGQVLRQGEAARATATDFAVRLDAEATAALEAGLYRLLLVAYSDELAQVTERRLELEAGLPLPEVPAETPVERASPTVEEVTPTAAATEAPPTAAGPVPPPAPKPGIPATSFRAEFFRIGVIVGTVVMIAILGAGALWWWRRQRRGGGSAGDRP
jgi:peptide/nickel transport system substrate-binding protein